MALYAYKAGDLTLDDFVGTPPADELGDTHYQVSGRLALANTDKRPKPPQGFVKGPPREPARRPSNRHSIATLKDTDRGDPKGRNTMIEPWVDVHADIDAINRGEGHYDRGTGRIWINGRLYGTHTDRTTGTIYPIEGHGFVAISSAQHYALRVYVRYNGPNTQAEHELGMDPTISSKDREVARQLWRMRTGEDEQ